MTIGYGDQAGYDKTAADLRNAAHANDDMLKRRGAVLGMAGSPTHVRNTDATGAETQQGAFMSFPLPVAGFAMIEAGELAETIELVSQSPCAVAHGGIEAWPFEEA